jgi:hypothetical protein
MVVGIPSRNRIGQATNSSIVHVTVLYNRSSSEFWTRSTHNLIGGHDYMTFDHLVQLQRAVNTPTFPEQASEHPMPSFI